MKTVREYLEELPEPIKSEALRRVERPFDAKQVRCLRDALDNFSWLGASDYWNEIYDRACDGEFDHKPQPREDAPMPELACGVVRFLDSSNNAEKSKLLEQLDIVSFRYTNSDQPQEYDQ
jgi:hypothetical protein